MAFSAAKAAALKGVSKLSLASLESVARPLSAREDAAMRTP